MADDREPKLLPDWYVREYWAWVDAEFDRWDDDDDGEFVDIEPDPQSEG